MKFMKQCTTCKDPNHKIKMFKLKGHNHYLSIDVLGRSHTPKNLIKIKEQNPETLTPQSPNFNQNSNPTATTNTTIPLQHINKQVKRKENKYPFSVCNTITEISKKAK